MAKVPKISGTAASAAAAAVLALLNSGYLRIYAGARPSTADDSVAGNTLLAELRFANPAFTSPVNGVATSNLITDDSAANATGTATFWRAYSSDGVTPILEGEVGTSNADLVLNSTNITSGASIGVATLSFTDPRS